MQEDIHEGKKTLMVIHALANGDPKDVKRLQEILSMKTEDEKTLLEGRDLLLKYGSHTYAEQKARDLLASGI